MPDQTAQRLADLRTLSKVALCDLWKQLFDASPPAKLRRDLMIPILAHRIQEQAFGSLGAGSRSRLRHLSRAFERESNSTITSAPHMRPGTRLVRQWRDRVHLVNVEANGYEYQGARYRSLSEIARLITGTRWSGPLFFGIKNEPNGGTRREAQ
jgi:Protein of unknown function (DUF2924)